MIIEYTYGIVCCWSEWSKRLKLCFEVVFTWMEKRKKKKKKINRKISYSVRKVSYFRWKTRKTNKNTRRHMLLWCHLSILSLSKIYQYIVLVDCLCCVWGCECVCVCVFNVCDVWRCFYYNFFRFRYFSDFPGIYINFLSNFPFPTSFINIFIFFLVLFIFKVVN